MANLYQSVDGPITKHRHCITSLYCASPILLSTTLDHYVALPCPCVTSPCNTLALLLYTTLCLCKSSQDSTILYLANTLHLGTPRYNTFTIHDKTTHRSSMPLQTHYDALRYGSAHYHYVALHGGAFPLRH